ncbi:unnamed protein product [Arctogadus glacialis]
MRGRGDITRAQRSSGRCVELQSGRPDADKAARDPTDGLRVNRFRAEPDPVPPSRLIVQERFGRTRLKRVLVHGLGIEDRIKVIK